MPNLFNAPLVSLKLVAGILALTGGLHAEVSFNRDIRPIMSDTCFQCHGPDAAAREAELRLDIREDAITERDGESAIIPGNPDDSLMMWMINAEDEEDIMPPKKHPRVLTQEEKQLFADWIAEGAEYEEHWAYLPPVRKPLPKTSDKAWPRNEVDYFVKARLEAEGIDPSPEAEKETLLRRLSFDLTGLPPALEEIQAFLEDDSPDAYEKQIDRLMDSPRYGERMVWDWLDAARYSDSNGYQTDPERGMYPWRDWAVNALNDNMPFDQFSVEQIAGDLLPDATQDQKLATAFLRNHMINGEGGRLPEENRIEYLFDQAETVGTIWMGLTMNCARCHDHKYDPITQKEYYQLTAFFNKTEVTGQGKNPHTPPILDLTTNAHKATLAQLKATHKEAARIVDLMELEIFPRPAGEPASKSERIRSIRDGHYAPVLAAPAVERRPQQFVHLPRLFGEEFPEYNKALSRMWDAYEAQLLYSYQMPKVMVMDDTIERDTYVLNRGIYNDLTDQKVDPGFPAMMNGGVSESGKLNRLDLAYWLMSDENPLTARVTVNRYWQTFFGAGLLKQVENFGVQSAPPIYEDLLDWLALEFRESGWDVKAIQKKILMSATYRQSSRVTAESYEHDPTNDLLARGPRFRMPSWMIRDAALAVSGLLVEKQGGKPVQPYQPDGIWKEATFGFTRYQQDHGEGLYRRSLYTFWRRIVGPPVMFDSAARQVCEVKQQRTNTPLHALTTLNDITYSEAARKFAERILTQELADDAERLEKAFQLVTARTPKVDELSALQVALSKYQAHFSSRDDEAREVVSVGEAPLNNRLEPKNHAAWATLCLLLLNLDETLTKE
ncbi:MAG: PSD1 and planctomycete cytochrome C domain-containing protein [Opitutales bacterium]|nr:PSD1 and planctomycete cytochrome C domain-containing protein [Opitutales bacterium]